MGLFTITDITFNKQDRTGQIDKLISNDEYQSNLLKYPEDIGNYDKGHYMVFYINQQKKTKFKRPESETDTPTIFETQAKTQLTSAVDRLYSSAVDGLENIINNSPFGTTESGSVIPKLLQSTKQISFERSVTRTTDAIALYMPDTLNFIQNQGYDSPSMTSSNIGKLAVAGASVVDEIKKMDFNNLSLGSLANVGVNMSPFLVNYIAEQFGGDVGRVLFATGFGAVRNPMIEVVYSTPELRTFRYDFMFWPRNSKEAVEVQKILDSFKYHQAPEVLDNTNGFFLVPPSEFDVKFYYGGKENPNIPKISTCVLETVDIDYAPNGWSAYEKINENTPTKGGTGTPVGVRLSLQFRETEIVTKDLLKQRGEY